MPAAISQTVDLRALAQKGEALSGTAPLSAFARLSDGLPALEQAVAPVTWSARAQWREPLAGLAGASGGRAGAEAQLWLHLQAGGEVPQTCQRCLGAYAQPVEVDRWFRFVADEATAEAEDDDSDEDLLVLEPRFDLSALVEDELLLALPLVPMHEVCPQPVQMSAGDIDENQAPDRPNPFAALAALKDRNSPT